MVRKKRSDTNISCSLYQIWQIGISCVSLQSDFLEVWFAYNRIYPFKNVEFEFWQMYSLVVITTLIKI